MTDGLIRPPAVAGTWYPGSRDALAADVDRYLAAVSGEPVAANVVALVAPHAGLMYSGPVAAHAYRQLSRRPVEVAVLVGPSHFVAFDGVAIWARGGFETPLGVATIDEELAQSILSASSTVHEDESVHRREHSLEMQLPFIKRVVPDARIVPLLMGFQTPQTAAALGDALSAALKNRSAVIIASTDLSHFHDATVAARLDRVVIDHVEKLDPEGLQHALDRRPDHACGGGPTVAVMRAARALGASAATILHYADSGDVSGDKSSVVGYLAAVLSMPAAGGSTGK